jgi:dTDP-4-dehydrorhamnose reductase
MLFPRVLITGADGLVGQALQRRLAHWREADVLATGLEPVPRMTARPGGYAPLDVTDTAALERAFLDFAPGVVVHAAALSKVEDCEADRERCWAVNVDATAALARLCKRHGARLVLLSTDFLFDGTDGPYAEDDRPAPVNAYGRTKLAAENAVRRSGLGRWTVVRTSLVFGAGRSSSA